MPDDRNVTLINTLAVQEMLNLPKLYGPHGFINRFGGSGTNGPPADLVAVLERLETATVDKPPLSGPGEMLVQHGQGRLM